MGQRSVQPEAILIAGPTASGKSALAIRLAKRFHGTIINADSMQVYRDLRVITARPSDDDLALAPHMMFGTIDGATNYSVSRWLADAARTLEDVRALGRLPILVGGTGLYLKALTEGLSEIPVVPDNVRHAIRSRTAGVVPAALHAELAARDPRSAARLRPTDPQRILRALEIVEATGRSIASFQDNRLPPILPVERCAAVVLSVDRDLLRERIDRRFDTMMDEGALSEVEALASRRLDPRLPVMRAHGVPPLLDHLQGQLAVGDAVARAKADTRRYIKRQETFARHQLPTFDPVTPDLAEDAIAARLGQLV